MAWDSILSKLTSVHVYKSCLLQSTGSVVCRFTFGCLYSLRCLFCSNKLFPLVFFLLLFCLGKEFAQRRIHLAMSFSNSLNSV